MNREEEIIQAALHYANNQEGLPITDNFSKNLCILAGQSFIDGAKWADKSISNRAIEVEIVGIGKEILDRSFGYAAIEGDYKIGDKVKIVVVRED